MTPRNNYSTIDIDNILPLLTDWLTDRQLNESSKSVDNIGENHAKQQKIDV